MSETLSEFEQIKESLKQAIFDGFIEVPMLPDVAHRTLLLTQDPTSNASQLAELIQRDQSLAGHVMRIANSAAYTPMANMVSLQQAISRLGMSVIGEIALSAVLGSKLFNTPGYDDYVEHNWQHALATSLWAKEIARLSKSNVEVSFLAGLLHSIGRPAVLQTIVDLSKQQAITLDPEQVHQLENSYSQQVTELVITRWNMPEQVIAAIKPYDEIGKAFAASKIAATVDIGAHFASYMLDIAAEDNTETLMHLPALGVLNLYPEQVEQLFDMEDTIQQRLEALSL